MYDRKFTIKGAQQYLKKPAEQSNIIIEQKRILKLSDSLDIQTLKDLKNGLRELTNLIEQFKD